MTTTTSRRLVIRQTKMDHREDDTNSRPSCFVRPAARRIAGDLRSTRVGRFASAEDLMRRTDIADGGRIDPIDVDIFSRLMRPVAIRRADSKQAQRLNVLRSDDGW